MFCFLFLLLFFFCLIFFFHATGAQPFLENSSFKVQRIRETRVTKVLITSSVPVKILSKFFICDEVTFKQLFVLKISQPSSINFDDWILTFLKQVYFSRHFRKILPIKIKSWLLKNIFPLIHLFNFWYLKTFISFQGKFSVEI